MREPSAHRFRAMHPARNFLELPGPESMVSGVLKALEEADFVRAASLACSHVANSGMTYFEACALAAAACEKGGQNEAALDYWQKIIKYRPNKTNFLEAGIRAAGRMPGEKAEKYLADWWKLIGHLYFEPPDPAFLANLTARGWQGKGAIGIQDGRLKGWFWLNHGESPRLALAAAKNEKLEIKLQPIARTESKILVKIDEDIISEEPFVLTIMDGAGNHITGSPIAYSPTKCAISARKKADGVSVIIPVYSDMAGTLACMATVLASLKKNKTSAEILVVWDCGPDQDLLARLRKLAAKGKIRMLENQQNIGFLATVNYALSQAAYKNALLLNSDTLVHGDWLDRMMQAGQIKDAATITALGNEAELMSFPSFKDRSEVDSLRQLRIIDKAAAMLDPKDAIREIPSACGFCMLITDRAIRALGGFDGKSVFRGYSEEAEYALRANDHGLKNYGAFNVFVAHFGEKSFGIAKRAYAAQNNEVIYKRYPDHNREYEISIGMPWQKEIRARISRSALALIAPMQAIEFRHWSERESPPWFKDSKYKPKKRGAIVFLRPGKNPRALLRVWAEIPFVDQEFDLEAGRAELLAALADLRPERYLACACGQPLLRLLADIGIQAEITPANDDIPELPQDLGNFASLLVKPPASLKGWQRLVALANRNPDKIFHLFGLSKLWQGAVRPANIYDIPKMDDYRPLRPDAFIFLDAARDCDGWQEWLQAHECGDIPFYKVGAND